MDSRVFPKEPEKKRNLYAASSPLFNPAEWGGKTTLRNTEFDILRERNFPNLKCITIDLTTNRKLDLSKLEEIKQVYAENKTAKLFITFYVPSPCGTRDKNNYLILHAITATLDPEKKEVHVNDPFYGTNIDNAPHVFNAEVMKELQSFFSQEGWQVIEDKIQLQEKGELCCNSLAIPLLRQVIINCWGEEFKSNRPLINIMLEGFKNKMQHYQNLYPYITAYNTDNDFGIILSPDGKKLVAELSAKLKDNKTSEITSEIIENTVSEITNTPRKTI
jgi:hypothetical protein